MWLRSTSFRRRRRAGIHEGSTISIRTTSRRYAPGTQQDVSHDTVPPSKQKQRFTRRTLRPTFSARKTCENLSAPDYP